MINTTSSVETKSFEVTPSSPRIKRWRCKFITSSSADAVLAMFSGESIHGGRADERRIGEKLDGRRYGPGSYLSVKAPSKPNREAERKSISKRPKEYGF